MYFSKPPWANSDPTILYSATNKKATPTAMRPGASTRRAFPSLIFFGSYSEEGAGQSSKVSSAFADACGPAGRRMWLWQFTVALEEGFLFVVSAPALAQKAMNGSLRRL